MKMSKKNYYLFDVSSNKIKEFKNAINLINYLISEYKNMHQILEYYKHGYFEIIKPIKFDKQYLTNLIINQKLNKNLNNLIDQTINTIIKGNSNG